MVAAISTIEELKEKFQDSLKLLNLKAICLINQGHFESAHTLLQKLLSVIEQNDELQDEKEVEISLHNFVSVSIQCGKPYQEQLM